MPSSDGKEFVKNLRLVINTFWDKDSNAFREKVSLVNLERTRVISKERVELLKKFVELIICTDYIKDKNVKIFLCSGLDSYDKVCSGLGLTAIELRKKVFYYCSVSRSNPGKLVKDFGSTFLGDIMYYGSNDISTFETALTKSLIKYAGLVDVQKEIILDVPKKKGCKNITNEEFNGLMSVIKPYMKESLARAKDSLSDEQCSYFWYLIDNQYSLNGEDKERFNELCSNAGINK